MGVDRDMVLNRYFHWVLLAVVVILVTTSPEAFAAATSTKADTKLSGVINSVLMAFDGLSSVLSALAWMIGSFLGISAVYKFKDHVDNPAQNPVSVPVRKMLAGGMFLSLPWVTVAARNALFGDKAGDKIGVSGFTDAQLSDGGLDKMVVDVISNIAGPMETLLTAFSYIAGIALLMVAIHRLTKRMEDGPRGPAGFGTIMTFIAAGGLISFGDSMGAFTSSLFGDNHLLTHAQIGNHVLTDLHEKERLQKVIEAVMVFVMIVGYIAFIRGWFVLKNFADGGAQNATLAQGLTFLFGGAIAINLGEFVNALQTTVNVHGITFI